jgi:iron complex transport system substrate-binding protein
MAAAQKTMRRVGVAILLACVALVASAPVNSAIPPVNSAIPPVNSAIPQFRNSALPRPARIISLVPAVTEMLYAIGAGPRVVAVSSYDRYPPDVTRLPNVGALLDPNVERILSLKPDLVVVYGTQTDLKQQLARAGISVYDYRHAGLADITTTIRSLGARTGDGPAADALAARIERELDGIRAKVRNLPKPRTLLVFGRERLALRGIYASGGVGFLNDMLETAGGANVFADVRLQSVQASTEEILAKRPDVVLEARGMNSAFPSGDRQAELNVWNALASVPAVRNHRVIFLFDDRIVIPGPRVVEGTLAMAKALHPDAFKAAEAERATKRERSGASLSDAPEGSRSEAAGAERHQ